MSNTFKRFEYPEYFENRLRDSKRMEQIGIAKELAIQFFKGKQQKDIKAELGTALGGVVGRGGKSVILAADGQSTLGLSIKDEMSVEKIYEIDKFTVVAGTGSVSFIQDIVSIFKADVNIIQASRGDDRFLSPKSKANILSGLVKDIMPLTLNIDISVGFLLAVYDPKDCEARLFQILELGSVSEKNIAAHGHGLPYVMAILKNYYKGMGGKDMEIRDMKWLAKRAINIAMEISVFCGGKKLLYIVDKRGARRTK